MAEAEMLALIDAPDVLLAYPLTGPKLQRLSGLIQKYPGTQFSFLIDNAGTLSRIDETFRQSGLTARVYIDLNLGMNRTGIQPENALAFFIQTLSFPSLLVKGLHAYDGHIRDLDFETRTRHCHQAFEPVGPLKEAMEKLAGRSMTLIAGGTPTCFIHAAAGGRECSPGTFVFWDQGYQEQLPEQPFEWAALVLCRVISIPAPDLVCVDLGYKSVASENPLPRVYFLNAPQAVPVAHSEEHLVLKVQDASAFQIGDILYGVPRHICPTVSLYDQMQVIEKNRVTGSWKILARSRQITL